MGVNKKKEMGAIKFNYMIIQNSKQIQHIYVINTLIEIQLLKFV